jgi:plasmid stabilization system protein ParE
VNDFRFTPQAADDLFEIWSYIAGDDPGAANRVEKAILDACSFLADAPLSGRIRAELTSRPLRFWPVRRFPHYIVAYDPVAEPVQIIRLLHGRRDLPPLLRQRICSLRRLRVNGSQSYLTTVLATGNAVLGEWKVTTNGAPKGLVFYTRVKISCD